MFATLNRFVSVACPDPSCKRTPCPFSHATGATRSAVVVAATVSATTTVSAIVAPEPAAARAKRTATPGSPEPPRKLLRTASSSAIPVTPIASTSAPVAPTLRVSAATSKVPVILRQTMVSQLFTQFQSLYTRILTEQPSLAAEHALQQEAEIHTKTNKFTYRNAVITCLAGLKKRSTPDSLSHLSVGTDSNVLARTQARDDILSFQLTPTMLEPLLISKEDMRELGYVVDIPDEWGKGGSAPSAVGTEVECDRCKQRYVVRDPGDADGKACQYHWGRLLSTRVSGEKQRMHTCCNEIAPGKPCEIGPHVFYESEPLQLHARHPFQFTQSGETDTALDIAALDCEMVYTTGGMRLARVSVVDVSSKTVFDELIRMDNGVSVLDYNTRFSGVTSLDGAVLDLAGARAALRSYISSTTIIVGHALENDLKALRMVHARCIDTVALFPHKLGRPYRRALRDIVREKLDRTIQNAGAAGHSSVEDSIAALDLVKWYIDDKKSL